MLDVRVMTARLLSTVAMTTHARPPPRGGRRRWEYYCNVTPQLSGRVIGVQAEFGLYCSRTTEDMDSWIEASLDSILIFQQGSNQYGVLLPRITFNLCWDSNRKGWLDTEGHAKSRT
ncbi:hypothetical protein BD410DRAFT_483568 [Rickenella mellea]|uniref:Uncharacterized protein n=1 Tax=Rickenella mellea TaxID=50990 RepID=A0A4Y7QIZ0_9AGAM|nr:hypothetical protein BD410DRAFT_483568 [Rickenella mellea]